MQRDETNLITHTSVIVLKRVRHAGDSAPGKQNLSNRDAMSEEIWGWYLNSAGSLVIGKRSARFLDKGGKPKTCPNLVACETAALI